MNIEQWKDRMKQAKTRSELLKAQDDLSKELESKAQHLKGLVKHAGWKVIEEYFDTQEKLLRDQLEIARPNDVLTFQTELKVLKKFRSFLRNLISQFEN